MQLDSLFSILSDINYISIIIFFSWFILAIGLIQNFIYILQLPAAWIELRKYSQVGDTESNWQMLTSDVIMPISLIMPSYNEEVTIVENVHSMLSLKYPDIEIIVVNDGSKDSTLQLLIDEFKLRPITRAYPREVPHAKIKQIYSSKLHHNLIVIDKENGGCKADACNAGLNISRNPLFCVVDADSTLEAEALLNSVRPFMEDPNMIAVGGTVRILNGCFVKNGQVVSVGLPKNLLALMQYMEYIRSFLMSRLAWSRWGTLKIISGAFGIFRRDITVEVNGFASNTVGEDYELVIKMHKHMLDKKRPYSMRYVPEPVCWTEAPETLKVLGNQRKRWHRGALEVFFMHKDMFLRPKYGKIGMLAFVSSLIIDVIGPIVEGIGYFLIPILWFFEILDFNFMLAFIAIFFIFGITISTCTLIFEEMELRRVKNWHDLVKLSFVAIIENFGYRQINNIWRIIGWWQFIRKKSSWGEMIRTGSAQKN